MAEKTDADATYWQGQITKAEGDNRYKRWIDLAQRYYDRYLLMADGMAMNTGVTGIGKRAGYNLLWSNTQTLLPMLYSRLPEPHISRKFNSRDPIARMAATIGERATMTDLGEDDFDDQATACALDYGITGRGTLRVIYDSTVVDSKIPVNQEVREDGSPKFITEQGVEIPQDRIERMRGRIFGLVPEIKDERAPIMYHNWRDFLIGPGRTWKEVQKRGWINWIVYMTKADATIRFGKDVANLLSYNVNPFSLKTDKNSPVEQPKSLEMLARIDETWDARSRMVRWTSPGYTKLLDDEEDFLELKGFFNTPRPLVATTGNDSLIPVPDYAQYFAQAKEMDEITNKIEQIMEEVRASGVYDANQPGLGTALKNKRGGWVGVDEWQNFLSKGGAQGCVQLLPLQDLIQAVVSLYQHRETVLADSDRISGMIDLFRGQQAQRDETLGQSNRRASMGGLRINDKQRDFQRYLRDALEMKTEVITSKFDPERVLQMADQQALMAESPEVARVVMMVQGDQFKEMAQQDPNALVQAQQAFQEAQGKQAQLIQAGLQLLQSDRMRTFKLDIETDATVAVDEAEDRQNAAEYVEAVTTALESLAGSPSMQQPGMKAFAADLVLFLTRRFRAGRSLEQKLEEVLQDIVTAPEPEPQPDPLMLEVQRRQADDQMDFQLGQQKNEIEKLKAMIDAFKAQTEAKRVAAEALEASKDSNRKDIGMANDILETADKITSNDGVVGNA